MKVVFFCENANQVNISNVVLNQLSGDTLDSAIFICLEWQTENFSWICEAAKRHQLTNKLENIYTNSHVILQKSLKKSRNKHHTAMDCFFDYFKNNTCDDNLCVIQYNDASVRGKALAMSCRNTGIKRVLIQDGFLNFQSKTLNLQNTDQNYFWGSSKPEKVFVWGEKMKDAIVARHLNDPNTISVVGTPKQDFQLPKKIKRPATKTSPRILLADQAILDQNKAPQDKWLQEFKEITDVLGNYDSTIRLHPSTTTRTIGLLNQNISKSTDPVKPTTDQIDVRSLQEYDIVLTYYSTVFLDCIAARVPCIIYRTNSIDIELPYIEHPLLFYCEKIDDVRKTIEKISSTYFDQSIDNSDIKKYINGEFQLDAICNYLQSAPLHTQDDQAETTALALSAQLDLNAILHKKILVLGGCFGHHIGVGRPIWSFIQFLKQNYINVDHLLTTAGPNDRFINHVKNSDIVIINSLDVIRTLQIRTLVHVLKTCMDNKIKVVFYCHETMYTYEALQKSKHDAMQVFKYLLLPQSTCLTVSPAQTRWLYSMGAPSVKLVYNSVGHFTPSTVSKEKNTMIVMVGTLQKRKGVDLFSQLADYSTARGQDWSFYWIGGSTKETEDCYRSPNVSWLGFKSAEETREFIAKASVFLLSSIDDPFPLSVGEALLSKTPVVIYKNTGFTDLVEDSVYGDVFHNYSHENAFTTIQRVLESDKYMDFDNSEIRKIIESEPFHNRMLSAISEVSLDNHTYSIDKKLFEKYLIDKKLFEKHSSKKKKSVKIKFLLFLQRTLPKSVTEPGERYLRKTGILKSSHS